MIQPVEDGASSTTQTACRQRLPLLPPPRLVQRPRAARTTDVWPPSSSGGRHLCPRPSTLMTSPIRIITRGGGGGGGINTASGKHRTSEDYRRLTNDEFSGRGERRARQVCARGAKMEQLIPTTRKRTELNASRHQRQIKTGARVLNERNNNTNTNTHSSSSSSSNNINVEASRRDHLPHRKRRRAASKMLRLIRWPLVHLCLPLCLITALMVAAPNLETANAEMAHRAHPTRTTSTTATAATITSQLQHQHQPPPRQLQTSEEAPPQSSGRRGETRPGAAAAAAAAIEAIASAAAAAAAGLERANSPDNEQQIKARDSHRLARRSPPWASTSINQQQQQRREQPPTRLRASSLLMPINELRVSGSKLEPPSRPSQDWSKQRPYFGASPQQQRNLSVELGKTAHLVCKVFELGDKTVSWLRPRENEILTAGKYTYVSDPRVSAMNDNGSTDWVLEIKDVGLNDSTSYECQVSTDPKLSQIFNLHVQAARARIKSGENNYYPVGANIEFACDLLPPPPSSASRFSSAPDQQIYWYHNGNLMNYAKTLGDFGDSGRPVRQNFTIDWDAASQLSRLRLANIQPADSGNYTCKPTAAEPATVRLFVKKPRNGPSGRVLYSGGGAGNGNAHHLQKEAQRTRQQHELGAEFMESSSSTRAAHVIGPSGALIVAVTLCLISTTAAATTSTLLIRPNNWKS